MPTLYELFPYSIDDGPCLEHEVRGGQGASTAGLLASTDRALQGFVLDVYDYEGLLLTLIDHAREDALSRALWSDVGALIEAKRLRLVAANFIPLMTPSSITLVINSSVDSLMILLLGFIGTEDDGSCLHPLAHAQHLETLDVSGWYRLTSANMEVIISSCHSLSRIGTTHCLSMTNDDGAIKRCRSFSDFHGCHCCAPAALCNGCLDRAGIGAIWDTRAHAVELLPRYR